MKRLFTIILFVFMLVTIGYSQGEVKRVYDEKANPMEQIDRALEQAKAQNKYVVCQVGGNWCPWCLLLADYIEKDSVVSKMIADNYVWIHVNYHPRRSAKSAMAEQTKAMMKRLGNPHRFGYPVLVVLNEQGLVIHTQDSGLLEEGKGYNHDKVVSFLKAWTPAAVKKAQEM